MVRGVQKGLPQIRVPGGIDIVERMQNAPTTPTS